jgi:hypothetical protein
MDALEVLLSDHQFRGRARRVRCFAHTLNLAAKAILRQFEKAKGKGKKHPSGEDSQPFDFDDLPSLAPIDEDDDGDDDNGSSDGDKTDLDDLEEMFDVEGNENQDARNEEEIDNLFEAMSVAEQEQWKEQVKPLRSALQKVRC